MPLWQRAAFLGCSFSLGVFGAFNTITLPLWLSGFTASYFLISLFSNTREFEAGIVSPLAGAWSDRTWAGWLGRRRPYILVGGLGASAMLALTPSFAAWEGLHGALAWLPPAAARIAPAALAAALFTLLFNLADDVHKALLADLTAGPTRSRLSGQMVLVEHLAIVGMVGLGALLWEERVPDEAFLVAGGLVALGTLTTVLGVREPPPALWTGGHAAEAPRSAPAAVWRVLTRYRGAGVLFLVSLIYFAGYNAVVPLFSVYVRDVLGATTGEAQLIPGLAILVTTATALPIGWLANRYGKRRLLGLGYAVMAAVSAAGLLVATKEQGAVVFALAGLAIAATNVLTIPLLADLVPRQHMGAAAGALAAAGSLSAPLASFVVGGMADLLGLTSIFGFLAATSCLALALLPAVRPAPSSGVPAPAPSA